MYAVPKSQMTSRFSRGSSVPTTGTKTLTKTEQKIAQMMELAAETGFVCEPVWHRRNPVNLRDCMIAYNYGTDHTSTDDQTCKLVHAVSRFRLGSNLPNLILIFMEAGGREGGEGWAP
jgi:hypothetical protein